MKDNLMSLLKNARNVVERRQFLFAYLSLVDSVEQKAEDLATIIDGLFTVTDFYKDKLTTLLKNQKEANSKEPYDGMTRRGDDGSWERYDSNVNEWHTPCDEYYDEDMGEWLLLECKDYE